MRPERQTLRVSWIAVATFLGGWLALAEAQTVAHKRFLDLLKLKGSGDYARALSDAKALASEQADYGAVRRAVVDLYLVQGDVDGARAYFEGLVERDPESAYGVYGLARVAFHQGELDGAVEALKRAVAIDPDFSELFGMQGGLPQVYEAKKELDAAIEYFEALTSSNASPANAFAGLGWSYARSFRFDEAIPTFSRALELDPDNVQSIHGLIQSYSRTSQFRKTAELCRRLSEVATRRGDYEMLAYAMMMDGSTAYRRGDYRTALAHLGEAQRLANEIGDKGREGSVVNNTAIVYATTRDYEKALQYFEISLDFVRESGFGQDELNALTNIGTVHREAGNYDRAIEYYRDVAAAERSAGFESGLAFTLANMGEAFRRRGDVDEATRYFDDALALAVETQNRLIEAYVAGSLGQLSRDRGHYAEAVTYFERQLALGEQTGEAEAIWHAQAGLGSAYELEGDGERAIEHYAEAIAGYDAVRESLAIESMGSSFLEDRYAVYPSIVQLLAAKSELEEAFSYTEKYKAKGFLDILARGQTLFESQLPDTLRLELDELQDELRTAYAESSREDASALTLDTRITELELKKVGLVDRVREEHGDFYQLALSEPLDVRTIQSDVLEPSQVLIEYLVGENKLSVFVVTRDELHYREVPVGRDELRRQLSELSPLFEVEVPRSRFLNAALADFSIPPARALYQALLEPIEAWLPDEAELIIVPDDFLFYLPFEALVVESDGAEHRYDFSGATFVVERYAVSYAAAASLLDPALRRTRTIEKGVLAFGNPTFTGEDQPPLPNSEAEVEAIVDAFRSYENGAFTQARATKAVFEEQAADYGVLHFATHFVSDDRQPLYSRIALAGDDVLETYEIFDAELNAELAVLSACNTGLGKLEKGEGLIGISRAFLYAGVPSLVVSLWSVDDEATARVMELFYEHLRSGASKKQALRQAKLDYLSEARGEQRDPFFWAPFILSGDWRPLDLPAPAVNPWLAPALTLLAAIGAVVIWNKRRRSPT